MNLKGQPIRHEIVYGVTSLSSVNASPKRLLALNRGHWGIENRLHWVRDVTFDEDRSQVRTGAGPRMMATMRNIAISLHRLFGKVKNVSKASRDCFACPEKVLKLIGI